MDLKKLKEQEKGLLCSNRAILIEYGKAYKSILNRCLQSSDPWLSDEVLISNKAQEFINDMKAELSIKNDENLRLQIYAASKLIIKDFLSKKEVKEILESSKEKYTNFDEARTILQQNSLYKKISPKTLLLILNDS